MKKTALATAILIAAAPFAGAQVQQNTNDRQDTADGGTTGGGYLSEDIPGSDRIDDCGDSGDGSTVFIDLNRPPLADGGGTENSTPWAGWNGQVNTNGRTSTGTAPATVATYVTETQDRQTIGGGGGTDTVGSFGELQDRQPVSPRGDGGGGGVSADMVGSMGNFGQLQDRQTVSDEEEDDDGLGSFGELQDRQTVGDDEDDDDARFVETHGHSSSSESSTYYEPPPVPVEAGRGDQVMLDDDATDGDDDHDLQDDIHFVAITVTGRPGMDYALFAVLDSESRAILIASGDLFSPSGSFTVYLPQLDATELPTVILVPLN
jgi:opacity protein-like surface antigen